jgi:hypothetical protein
MKTSEEFVDINSFLEEMVGLIEERLKKQEAAISRIESEVKRLKKSLERPKERKNVIDKSVLKILRQ